VAVKMGTTTVYQPPNRGACFQGNGERTCRDLVLCEKKFDEIKINEKEHRTRDGGCIIKHMIWENLY